MTDEQLRRAVLVPLLNKIESTPTTDVAVAQLLMKYIKAVLDDDHAAIINRMWEGGQM